jgi:hypothetical protein
LPCLAPGGRNVMRAGYLSTGDLARQKSVILLSVLA